MDNASRELMVRNIKQVGSLGLVALLATSVLACGADPTGGGVSDANTDAMPGIDASPIPSDGGQGLIDGGVVSPDAGDLSDGGVASSDGGGASDGGVASLDAGDLSDGGIASPDAGVVIPDGGIVSPDAGLPDAGLPDAGLLDAGLLDAGLPDAGGGITTACTLGDGQALWRLTFPPNAAGYATVEEWDNGCEYSLADQACSLSGEPHSYANFGPGILFNSSNDYFRVRFSVAGLSFTQATIYISAHADGSGIPNAVLESPLYGSLSFAPSVPISTHRTYAVDWTSFLSPSDNPNLTAVTLRSNPTGLAVSEIQLCVQ